MMLTVVVEMKGRWWTVLQEGSSGRVQMFRSGYKKDGISERLKYLKMQAEK